jgi:signal peptidase I
MLSTAIVVSTVVGSLVGGWLLWAKFLQWGARWAKVSHVTFRCALVIAVLVQVIITAVAVLLALVPASTDTGKLVLAAVELIFQLAVTLVIIRRVLRATTLQAIMAWLPTLAVSAIAFLFALLVIRPFVVEAFSISSNSMVPTLLGRHRVGTCPRCGSLAYGSGPNWDSRPGELHPMICTKELAFCEVQDPPPRLYPGDRMLVLKVLPVRRWDLMAYRLPEDPTEKYVHRVVGLPGEELYIDGGYVWIDGKKLEPPEPIRNLRYLTAEDVDFSAGWANKDAPVRLGPDEYFVLGDFSARSKDSRLWNVGAPGHHAYAVPASHIIGVVTHIYWPPSRWRIIR